MKYHSDLLIVTGRQVRANGRCLRDDSLTSKGVALVELGLEALKNEGRMIEVPKELESFLVKPE